MQAAELTNALLAWYDGHARDLPWRVGPAARKAGQRPDPYRVWLSEVMLQQTTVATVRERFARFLALWPQLPDLAAATDEAVMAEWAGLGYYARARNLLKCAREVAGAHDGRFPDTRDGLIALPGIGPYTAAAIAAIAFDRPETVVDGNVERVVSRLFAITDPLPGSKGQIEAGAARLTPRERPGDHAQAMMDLGATICTSRNPACGICPLMAGCAGRARGIAAELPAKAPKKPRPLRRGLVYLARRADGAWLVERRPAKGLLGGMLGFPGSDWAEGDLPPETPPATGDWLAPGVTVEHGFTHFRLELSLRLAILPPGANPERGHFALPETFDPAGLPTLMRKVHDAALPHLPQIERGAAAGL